jgi:trehalose 6-phosphate synthase
MSERRKLIVVSNRGPLSFDRDEHGERVVRRGGGGLATALRGLIAHHDVTWIASAMSDEDRVVAAEHGEEPIEETRNDVTYLLRLAAHDPLTYDRYYNIVANGTFWFVQHYLWGLASAPDIEPSFRVAWRDGYQRVNRAFADMVVAELDRSPGSEVFVHDYHLYLAPGYVREARPDARLLQFVHIPWAQPDYWHVLPEDVRVAVHEGVLANDVVGFHTDRWRGNFVQACTDLLGAEWDADAGCLVHDDRRTHVVARPIGIDPGEFEALKEHPTVLEEERKIVASRPEVLIVRVDRSDPSKNVVRGFRAFALLLQRYPELAGTVGMLALLDPSRQDLAAYTEYLVAIQREARALNERFGTDGWQPIDLRVGDNFFRSVAAYKQFDVLLVNPIFDGMNLVAKEAPFVNERDGVVVLSENAGAHEGIGEWTITVNPFDIEGTAEGLHHALTMPPDERRRRARAIAQYVRENDVERWSNAQLDDLDRVCGTVYDPHP